GDDLPHFRVGAVDRDVAIDARDATTRRAYKLVALPPSILRTMFDIDTLVADCRTAVADADPRSAIRDVLTRTVAKANDVAGVLGKDEGGINLLYNADDLTILNVIWAPKMRIFPHDHRMWAAIGIYGGAEANTIYRRGEERLQEAGGRLLDVGDVFSLGAD